MYGCRRVASSTVADDRRRHALADRALGGRGRKQREVAVAVRVDEAGAHHLARRIDDPGCRGSLAEAADLDDVSSLDRDVTEEGRATGPVGDPAVADQGVEHDLITSCRPQRA